jgi:Zn-dependent protease
MQPPRYAYSYTYAPARPVANPIRTSRTELTHLGIAFVVLTFDLTLILGGGTLLAGGAGLYGFSPFLVATAAAAALTGFLFHELAHKIAAERRGYWAEFRMAPVWLLISIFTALIGWLWAAPGATVVNGMSDVRQWGRTSLAGPMTNFAFGAAFFGASVLTHFRLDAATPYLLFLTYINGWFAAFNLLPFGPLDGRKVLTWDAGVWAASFVCAAALAVVGFLGILYGTPILFR